MGTHASGDGGFEDGVGGFPPTLDDDVGAEESESGEPLGPVDCGEPGSSMVCVPEGPFLRGCPTGHPACSLGPRLEEVVLTTFEIDMFEVTVGDYAACVGAGGCSPVLSGTLCTINAADLGSDYPVNCIGWDQANDYCAWVGKRLPTELEWEKAARGTDGGSYPWGETPPSCTQAVWWPDYPDGPGPYPAGAGCSTGGPLPIGSRPEGISPFGVHDMAGNISEWVADDAADLGPEFKMLRGGAFLHHNADTLLTWARLANTAVGNPNQFNGFRCARGPVN